MAVFRSATVFDLFALQFFIMYPAMGQALNLARPGPEKSGRHSLITSPAWLRPAANGQKPKIRPIPAHSPTVWRQSSAFEMTAIYAIATSLPGKVLFYFKYVRLFSLSYVKVQNVYVACWLCIHEITYVA